MSHRERRQGSIAGWLSLAACLVVAGCGPSPSPVATRAIRSEAPIRSPSPVAASARPPALPGTSLVPLPDAGILLPVPLGWRTLSAAEVSDPDVRADLALTYPGMGRLFEAFDAVGSRASPAFMALDPAMAGSAEPITANLSVLVSQPSVGGPALDLVAALICEGLTTFLGATGSPSREHRQLPIGEGVRCAYDVAAEGGGSVSAVSWVIGAPAGTLLVTLAGPARSLGEVTADAVAGSIEALPSPAP